MTPEKPPLRVAVVGTRGIPDIQGGVETHCQELYPLIADNGVEITLMRRKPYADAIDSARGLSEWHGVRLIDIDAPRRKSLEAIIHTTRALLEARRQGADIVHIHAIGPAIMTPLARLLGMKVVMTNHGPDYDRDKWGRLASAVLRLGERLGARFANRVIAISPHIAAIIRDKYGVEAEIIPNGVPAPEVPQASDEIIARWGLKPRRYVVALGRFVPEKRFDLLIEAFTRLASEGAIPPDFKLVIAGDADHPDAFSEGLKEQARRASERVVLTGFIRGDSLHALMSRAALFAMPSTHEGLPIALLEAMSYGLDVAVSDIEACRLPELESGDFFPVDSLPDLINLLKTKITQGSTPREYDLSRYSWPSIADATLRLYKSLGG